VYPKQLEKLLNEKAWFFAWQNGSHKIYKHKDFWGVVIISFHGKNDLSKGTLNSIFKQAS
jgi:predicted RNA binding protein YcfA (HicA-like mRNA interferase family)